MMQEAESIAVRLDTLEKHIARFAHGGGGGDR